MKGEPAAAGTAAAAPRRLTRRVRLERTGTRLALHAGTPLSRMFLAALAGALAVTCVSAVLVLLSSAPTPQRQAIEDGRQVLSYLWKDCGSKCTVQALTQTTPGTWRVRVQTPRWRRCFLITPAEYAYVPGHGVTGLSAAACR